MLQFHSSSEKRGTPLQSSDSAASGVSVHRKVSLVVCVMILLNIFPIGIEIFNHWTINALCAVE